MMGPDEENPSLQHLVTYQIKPLFIELLSWKNLINLQLLNI